jgi:hypothetical protein
MTPPPLIFLQPQVPPSKEFAKKPKDPPWISNYCASMFAGGQPVQRLLGSGFAGGRRGGTDRADPEECSRVALRQRHHLVIKYFFI